MARRNRRNEEGNVPNVTDALEVSIIRLSDAVLEAYDRDRVLIVRLKRLSDLSGCATPIVKLRRIDESTVAQSPTQASITPVADRNEPSPAAPQPIEEPVFRIPAVPPPRRRHAVVPHRVTYQVAGLLSNDTAEDVERYHIGEFVPRCRYCSAKFFTREHRSRTGDYNMCCKFGKIMLPPLGACPNELRRLLTADNRRANEYRNNIRVANSNFAMAIIKAKIPEHVNAARGAWCFTVCGQMYHMLDALPVTLDNTSDLERSHLYFVEADRAIDRRSTMLQGRLSDDTIATLENMLRRVNRWVQSYASIGEELRESGATLTNVVLAFKENMRADLRTYNLPESRNEVAAIFRGVDPPFNVELRLYPRDRRQSNSIKNLNRLADPFVYPLMFPRGEYGYDNSLRHTGVNANKIVTFLEFYSFRLQVRNDFSIIRNSGKLFQQYIVDAYIKIEANRLWYLRTHQQELRTENYAGLARYLEERARERQARVGKLTLLPAAYIGSPRHKNRMYLDAMAIFARHGMPDLLITFTCNPRWPEITDNLEFRQKREHRPDLISRVFNVKLREFIDDVANKQLYGVITNYMYVIEFQKRGLPHAHILVTLVNDDKITDPDSCDKIIRATIPDAETEPLLHAIVTEHYVHKPCGQENPLASCMKDGKCSKHYPKNFAENTTLENNAVNVRGRHVYRRPNDRRGFLMGNTLIDNRRIVPYNPYAAVKYDCHINFEMCLSLLPVKYLYKYIHKGPDCVTVQAQGETDVEIDGVAGENNVQNDDVRERVLDWDEIKTYLDCRYVSSIEAAWRIFEFPMHGRSHSVLTLTVHLPGEQAVRFRENEDIENVLEGRGAKNSTLMGWFDLNARNESARRYKYVQMPEHYTWEDRAAEWKPRRQISKQIGCLAEVSPQNVNLFHLRMLLVNRPGARSFEDLRTVNGVVCDTFVEACRMLNLLENVDEYDRCMLEVATYKHPSRLRKFFALICTTATEQVLPRMHTLWETYKRSMMEDFLRAGMAERQAESSALLRISVTLRDNGSLTLRSLGLPEVDEHLLNMYLDDRFDEYVPLEGDDVNAAAEIDRDIENLNADQRSFYDAVVNAIYGAETGRKVFYLDGAAGTGKTFVYNVLLNAIAARGDTTIAVAWTGIAAALLKNGRTVHNVFRLPLWIQEESAVGYPIQDDRSRIIAASKLILWDEAPMAPKMALHAIDRYLRDLMMQPTQLMGGKVVVLGGDFRQVLPVIPRAHRTSIIAASIITSDLWQLMDHRSLSINMRAEEQEQLFSDWLLELGSGNVAHVCVKNGPVDLIRIPQDMLVADVESLLRETFGDDCAADEAAHRVIVCPTNAAVNMINERVLENVHGEVRIFLSRDEFENDPESDFFAPLELLNSVNVPSLPPHELILKNGCVVILLRNLDVAAGLCNGTRFRVVAMSDIVLQVQHLAEERRGEIVYIPRIKMQAHGGILPKPMTRLQFPVKLAFAMTINKAQGQTFDKIGIYLNEPCFAHGQLYVAFSRVRTFADVKVFIIDTQKQGKFSYRDGRKMTRNVVYDTVVNRERLPINTDAISRTHTVNVDNVQVPRHVSQEARDSNQVTGQHVTGSVGNDENVHTRDKGKSLKRDRDRDLINIDGQMYVLDSAEYIDAKKEKEVRENREKAIKELLKNVSKGEIAGTSGAVIKKMRDDSRLYLYESDSDD